jgi:outer membrane murein-binding lipoprotein Lpp
MAEEKQVSVNDLKAVAHDISSAANNLVALIIQLSQQVESLRAENKALKEAAAKKE